MGIKKSLDASQSTISIDSANRKGEKIPSRFCGNIGCKEKNSTSDSNGLPHNGRNKSLEYNVGEKPIVII